MTEYDIRIQTIEDAQQGIALFPEFKEELFRSTPLTFKALGILQGGMQSGKASTFLVLTDEKGKHYTLEMGAEAYLTIGGGIKGALARFGQPWTGA